MKSIKPGRGPSMMGGVTAVVVALLGVLWVIGATSMTSGFSVYGGGGMDMLLPLFGVGFVLIAVISAVYHFHNAAHKQRYSEYDVVDSSEEPDPLSERFSQSSVHFCPYCGEKTEPTHRFCANCGKKLSDTADPPQS